MMRQGYTLVWSAWDAVSGTRPDVGGGPFVLDAPIALNPDGSDVVGPSLEEFVIDDDKTSVEPLTYPAASLDTAKAVLTFRAEVKDKPIAVAADQWRLNAAGTTVSLLPEGTKFKSGMLYELVYPAKIPDCRWTGLRSDPRPCRLSPLRQCRRCGQSKSPRGRVAQVYTTCVSQPCRFMRDFVALGFNEDADTASQGSGRRSGRRVVDGVLNWVGGASGVFLNYRFAQPFRTHRQHIARWYPEFQFPFAYQTTTDSVTGRTDGLLRRCSESRNLPEDHRGRVRQRILGEGRSAGAYRYAGPRFAGGQGRADISHGRPAPRRRDSGLRTRHLPRAAQPACRKPRNASLACRIGRLGRGGRRASRKLGSAHWRWDIGRLCSAGRGISAYSRGPIQRPDA